MHQIVECVPNFSEGRDENIIQQIAQAIQSVDGVKLLNVDPGKATNRTVYTFVGPPDYVLEAAFQGIKKATELIDMTKHTGEHPRFGATDVCPFIPVKNIGMDECIALAKKLAKRVGETLQYPVYLYESAASNPDRVNLANIRSGEYEGLAQKLKDDAWIPDFGPRQFVPKTGATAIGARDFLIAVNFNLNTTSVRRANAVAFDVREAGRVKKEIDKTTGKEIEIRIPGKLKACKAIGWYIEEYGIAQVSMNLTNISITTVHEAFEAISESAQKRGMRVTGTEIVGMLPLKVLTDAGKYFLRKQQRSIGVSEEELVKIAIKSLGLSDLTPFNPREKVLEYQLKDISEERLVSLNLKEFSAVTASESPAPGGGSIAALCGVMGAALGTMVANLSSHKRGWDENWAFFSDWAEKGEKLRQELLYLIDADTKAFDNVMSAFSLPKNTENEKLIRKQAIQEANKNAVSIPLETMRKACESIDLLKAMSVSGNPNSITDVGVGALCMRTAVYGAWLNVKINLTGIDDLIFRKQTEEESNKLLFLSKEAVEEILNQVETKL